MRHITIALGTDHRGIDLKKFILNQCTGFEGIKISWLDVGTDSEERVDYPIYAKKAIEAMKDGKAEYAVLICATGVGMAITANRYKGIYAAVAWNAEMVAVSKEDDNINVLVFPSDYIHYDQVGESINRWLTAKFKGGRYLKRLEMIDE